MQRKKAESDYYSQFPFHPKINEISKKIGKTALHSGPKSQEKDERRKALIAAADEEQRQHCTFTPKLFKPPPEVQNGAAKYRLNLSNPDHLNETIEHRRKVRERDVGLDGWIATLPSLCLVSFAKMNCLINSGRGSMRS